MTKSNKVTLAVLAVIAFSGITLGDFGAVGNLANSKAITSSKAAACIPICCCE